jgi:two-component system, sensor histidine kinase PdtaS
MKKTLLLLAFSVVVLRCKAQEVSSTDITKTLSKATHLSFKNLDSALYYANQALVAAQNLDSPRLVFKAQQAMGRIYEDNNRFMDAKKAYQVALDLANEQLKPAEQFSIYTDWAIVHKKMGQYGIAREYHLLTITRAEKLGNWAMAEDGYHGLGTLYSMLSDFNQSIQYYHLSIQAAEKWGNKKGIVLSNQNISNIYMKAQNHDMALAQIEKTLILAHELGDSVRIAAVLNIYGKINMSMDKLPQALDKYLAAKAIFEHRGDKPRLTDSYLAIAGLYLKLKNYTQAASNFDSCIALKSFMANYSYADYCHKKGLLFQAQQQPNKAVFSLHECLKLTDSFGFKDLAQLSHTALSDIYTQEKQFEKALVHLQNAKKLGEELFEEDKNKNMTEAQFKYDMGKKDSEIASQKHDLRISSWTRSIFAVLCLALMILLYFSWQQVKAKQLATKNAQLLLKELHHRVKNNMQTIASMIRVQARQSQDPFTKSILEDNKLRLEAFAMVHQQLYKNANSVEKVDLQVFIEKMIDKLRFSHGLSESQFKLHLFVENKALEVETALSIGLILNELLTNSMKYAYPSLSKMQPLEISIDLSKNQMYYKDNGNAVDPDFNFNQRTGFGIMFITTFVRQIKGKHSFHVDNGVHFQLTFPNV